MIFHDYIEQTDGGSRLCLELAKGLNTTLLCGFIRRNHPFLQDITVENIKTICPSIPVPLLRQYMLAQSFIHYKHLEKKDYAIYSGSYAPLAVRNSNKHKNILYCHTPPRFLYDKKSLFEQNTPKPLRFLLSNFCKWLQPIYEEAARDMNIIIANSVAVQGRIKIYLQLPSIVVNPPCCTHKYFYKPSQGYFLSMVRLDALKRVDLLIQAFKQLPQERLVIISAGPEEKKLKKLAKNSPNITFAGVLSEKQRISVLSECRASICIAESEDFGMCAVESLAAGKPVIVSKAGGLQDIIQHKITGLCIDASPNIDEIKQAIIKLDENVAKEMQTACKQHAVQYDTRKFIKQIQDIVGS